MTIDGMAGREDRTGRLHREARDDRLTGGNPAEDSARVVGAEFDLAIPHPHLIGVVLTGQGGGGEALADFDALHGVDRHQRAGQIGVELAVNRRAQTGRHPVRHQFDHRADGGSGLTDRGQHRFPFAGRHGIGAEERIVVHRVPVPARPVDFGGAHLHERAANAHRRAEHDPRHAARRHPHRRFPRRGPAAAAVIAYPVFQVVRQIRMPRAERFGDGGVIAGALVRVDDPQPDRGSRRHAVEHAGHDLDLIRLLPLRGEFRLAGPAAIQPGL